MTTTMRAPTFSGPDWTSRYTPIWERAFAHLGMVGSPGLRFLEIGCCEGRSTIWFLEHVLTDPTSTIEVIDTFDGSPEFVHVPELDTAGLGERFRANLAPWAERVTVHQGPSRRELCALLLNAGCHEAFDFVYVDGSHHQVDTLTDGVLAWPLVRPGGLMIFDDAVYAFQLSDGTIHRPRIGINAFMSAFVGQYDIVIEGAQMGLVKR